MEEFGGDLLTRHDPLLFPGGPKQVRGRVFGSFGLSHSEFYVHSSVRRWDRFFFTWPRPKS
jgi:hypothetical protein